MLQGAKLILLLKAFFLFKRKEFQSEHWSWLNFSVKMEVWKTIDMNIKFPKFQFFNACLYFASIGPLIIPTFDTKVTEYLCLGWVFFLQTSFDFLTSLFWRNFKISIKTYCWPELKFENIFHLWSFFVKLWGLEYCHSCQFGTINARYISRRYRLSVELIRLEIVPNWLKEACLP